MMTGIASPAAMPYPTLARAWAMVAVLLLALTVSFVDRQILTLMVQPVRADLGISDTQISLLHGVAFTLFYVFLGLPLGRLADHRNRQWLIIGGILVWSLATIACGFAHSFATLFAARLIVGIGEATLSPAAYSLIADYFSPERRARAMSIYSLGPVAGTGLALILGGQAVAATSRPGGVVLPLIGLVHGWQAAFIIVGLPGFLVAAMMLTVREPPRRERHGDGAGIGDTLAFIRSRAAPFALVSIGIGLSGSVVAFGFGAWLPTAFIRLHAWTAPQIACAMGIILLSFGIAGAVTSGILADWLTRRGRQDSALQLAAFGVAAMLPTIPAVGLAKDPWVALAAYAWLNFFLGMPTALAMPILQGITPNEYRGQAAALYLLAVTLVGLGCGPTLIALVTDKLFADDRAIGSAMALVITLSAAAGLGLLLLARRVYVRHLITIDYRRTS